MSEAEFSFATCDRRRALGFLRAVYPSTEVCDTPDDAGPLLDLIARDIVRVQDPAMHRLNGCIQLLRGHNWNDDEAGRVMSTARAFHDLHRKVTP
jgi:hypothetical protein